MEQRPGPSADHHETAWRTGHGVRGSRGPDAVESLRGLVRDLKHDVRMLRVVTDKQSAMIEQLVERVDRS